ncbi:hypothetical protein Lal_00047575 [Lupinus albus]|nr:hypothetical protein Lal_00047575 [Lupinus albus]
MASILLLLEALIRCSHHELLTQHQNWKEKEINFFRPIIKVEKQGGVRGKWNESDQRVRNGEKGKGKKNVIFSREYEILKE